MPDADTTIPATPNRGNIALVLLVLLLAVNICVRLAVNAGRPTLVVDAPAGAVGETRLDINKASEDEFACLPGIGPVRARQIVDYRRLHGRFNSVKEIGNIKGFGDKTVERLAGLLEVSP